MGISLSTFTSLFMKSKALPPTEPTLPFSVPADFVEPSSEEFDVAITDLLSSLEVDTSTDTSVPPAWMPAVDHDVAPARDVAALEVVDHPDATEQPEVLELDLLPTSSSEQALALPEISSLPVLQTEDVSGVKSELVPPAQVVQPIAVEEPKLALTLQEVSLPCNPSGRFIEELPSPPSTGGLGGNDEEGDVDEDLTTRLPILEGVPSYGEDDEPPQPPKRHRGAKPVPYTALLMKLCVDMITKQAPVPSGNEKSDDMLEELASHLFQGGSGSGASQATMGAMVLIIQHMAGNIENLEASKKADEELYLNMLEYQIEYSQQLWKDHLILGDKIYEKENRIADSEENFLLLCRLEVETSDGYVGNKTLRPILAIGRVSEVKLLEFASEEDRIAKENDRSVSELRQCFSRLTLKNKPTAAVRPSSDDVCVEEVVVDSVTNEEKEEDSDDDDDDPNTYEGPLLTQAEIQLMADIGFCELEGNFKKLCTLTEFEQERVATMPLLERALNFRLNRIRFWWNDYRKEVQADEAKTAENLREYDAKTKELFKMVQEESDELKVENERFREERTAINERAATFKATVEEQSEAALKQKKETVRKLENQLKDKDKEIENLNRANERNEGTVRFYQGLVEKKGWRSEKPTGSCDGSATSASNGSSSSGNGSATSASSGSSSGEGLGDSDSVRKLEGQLKEKDKAIESLNLDIQVEKENARFYIRRTNERGAVLQKLTGSRDGSATSASSGSSSDEGTGLDDTDSSSNSEEGEENKEDDEGDWEDEEDEESD